MIEEFFEKLFIGFFIIVGGAMLIIIPLKIGSILVESFGTEGLLLIPLGLLGLIGVGTIFNLLFPDFTIYDKEGKKK